MNDAIRVNAAARDLFHQAVIIFRASGIEFEIALIDGSKFRAGSNRDQLFGTVRQFFDNSFGDGTFDEYQPCSSTPGGSLTAFRQRSRFLPRRRVEPIFKGAPPTITAACANRVGRTQIYPVTLPIELISRQRQTTPLFARAEAAPVRLDAREPQSSECIEEKCRVRLLFFWMTDRRRHQLRRLLGRMPSSEASQGAARPNLKEYGVGIVQKLRQSIREANGASQVPGPVSRISSFGGGDPRPGHV